jgi:hypothetical protein
VIEREVQADGFERAGNPSPDFVARHAEILAAECHVVPDAGKDYLRIRILQHQARIAARARGRTTVDEQLARGVALLVPAQYPGERLQQRRLARTGAAEQKHSLPRGDVEVETVHRGRTAGCVSPSPAPRPNADAAHPCHTHAWGTVSRPEANRLSAPERARPRAASHDSRPATRTPEITADTK